MTTSETVLLASILPMDAGCQSGGTNSVDSGILTDAMSDVGRISDADAALIDSSSLNSVDAMFDVGAISDADAALMDSGSPDSVDAIYDVGVISDADTALIDSSSLNSVDAMFDVGAISDAVDVNVDAADGDFATAPGCSLAPSGTCWFGVCSLDALPTGETCAIPACTMLVDPCPQWQGYEPTVQDAYGCSCVGGLWQCSLLGKTQGICPDGGLTDADLGSEQTDAIALEGGGEPGN
jgi:hypothetical protein